MSAFLFREVEVDGRIVDVRAGGGRILEVARGLVTLPGEEVVEGGGCALLPALHDHHLHLLSLAASRRSVDCSAGPAAIAAAPGSGWVRGVGCPTSVDRHVLDALEPGRPVRVQHRSGGLWMLNSVALAAVAAVLDGSEDVERDPTGAPTGRLWRYDDRLRPALPENDLAAEVASVLDELGRLGIGSVTDATPDLDPTSVALLRGTGWPITLLGDPGGEAPWKLHLRDHDLPDFDRLSVDIAAQHGQGRAVAVHCVTREALLLTLAVLDAVGRLPGDRIEHAAVVPDPSALQGLTVVTQPGFVAARGDDYLRDVRVDDRPCLYRYRSLLDLGVHVLPSSDAPFGPLSPWGVMRAARDRRTTSGRVVGEGERTSVTEVLNGYLHGPDGRLRRVRTGAPARLLLCAAPLAGVLADPDDCVVRRVVG